MALRIEEMDERTSLRRLRSATAVLCVECVERSGVKSQLRPRGGDKTKSNGREKAGDAGVYIDRYCSMEVEALQAWRAWQERKTEQQSKTAWILSWSKRRCGSPRKRCRAGKACLEWEPQAWPWFKRLPTFRLPRNAPLCPLRSLKLA